MVTNFKGAPSSDTMAANQLDSILAICEMLLTHGHLNGPDAQDALVSLNDSPFFQALIGLANQAAMSCAADH